MRGWNSANKANKMKQRRVAITGLGAVSPIGHDVHSTWNNLLAGHSGIAEIQQFDAQAFPTYIAAEVKDFRYIFY